MLYYETHARKQSRTKHDKEAKIRPNHTLGHKNTDDCCNYHT